MTKKLNLEDNTKFFQSWSSPFIS